jgi:uncharacterized protein involved in response to NO
MLYHRKCQKGFGRDYRSFSHLAVIGSTFTALTAGFGFAAVLSFHSGLGWSVGDWWTPTTQAHGHVQLIGWLGLFIVGVSLFFVPRLSGVPLQSPRLVVWVVSFLLGGVCLRGVLQPILPFFHHGAVLAGLLLSAFLEAVGIAIYLYLILSSVLRASVDRSALMSIRPYLVSTICGWIGFTVLNVYLSYDVWLNNRQIFDLRWTRLATDLFLGATLIPVCLAFSVRTFPLYLRLPAAKWRVQALGIGYLLVFLMLWAIEAWMTWESGRHLSGVGHALRGTLLILFIWKLDVLLRIKEPWTSGQIAEPSDGANPTRPGLPDHGEFGRFERLLYLAYGWLLVGSALDLYLGLSRIAGYPDPIDADALRHVFLAGFASSLLIGMAPRMVPGFVQQRQVAYPGLVNVTFWLWGLATFCRILPLLFAPIIPASEVVSNAIANAFAASGAIGWLAIAVLMVNLLATLRRSEAATAEV